mmetsp:Transcript_32579/g.66400  ORF Transcript_32579/g.66400 Transcript_32579/m.66400 type:complete len:97 (-) Transcript_32579:515-805(-)
MELMRMELVRIESLEVKQAKERSDDSKDGEEELIAVVAVAVPDTAVESILHAKQVEEESVPVVRMDFGKNTELEAAVVAAAAAATSEAAVGPIHSD